jgi:uncharacterized protein
MPRPCPVCRRPSDPGFRPFCSRPCADADLGRWLTEAYRVPVSEEEEAAARLDREDEPG